MYMRFDQPFDGEPVFLDKGDDPVSGFIGDVARRVINVHHRINDRTSRRRRIFHDIRDRVRGLFEERGHFRFLRKIDHPGNCRH